MNYQEMLQKALQGRSVCEVSRLWGVPQSTLNRFIRGERLPDFHTALRIAEEAEIAPGDALRMLAKEEQIRKIKNFKLQSGFVQITLAAALALGAVSTNFILCQIPARRKNPRMI